MSYTPLLCYNYYSISGLRHSTVSIKVCFGVLIHRCNGFQWPSRKNNLYLSDALIRDGRPALRGALPAGRGGSPPRPALWGGGGLPAPPCPVKMIKTAGKLRGKVKARISTFSNRGNK